MRYKIVASLAASDPQVVEDAIQALQTLLPYMGDNVTVTYEYENKVENYLGLSVSHGTMRDEDLRDRFEPVLKDLDPIRHALIFERYEQQPGDAEDLHELVINLFDALGELAPEGYYFGAIEGDGSDYGFWESSDD